MALFCKRRRIKESVPEAYIVTIKGKGNGTYCHVTIDGVKYSTVTGTYEYPPGTVITAKVQGESSTKYGSIVVDGVEFVHIITGYKTYEYELDGNVEIELSYNTLGARKITITRV